MPDILKLEDLAPDFSLPADNGEEITLSHFRGKTNVLVFFYPADFTPVCTAEVAAFRDDFSQFQDRDVTILGISGDPVDKHRQFAAECKVPFRLLSDATLEVARTYGARGLLGMRRAYFLIDREGVLRWQHAEVLPIFKLSNSRILEMIDSILGESETSPPPKFNSKGASGSAPAGIRVEPDRTGQTVRTTSSQSPDV